MFKNLYFRLGLISSVAAISLLIALPRIQLKSDNRWLKLDSFIGGYTFSFFGGRYNFDFTEFKKGLDLNGGVKIVLEADMTGIEPQNYNSAVESAVIVIERRVNLLGVSEPLIASNKVGDKHRIIVEIPGVANITDAISLIGSTAKLKFKTLNAETPWDPEKFQDYYFNPSVWEETGVTGSDLIGADMVFGSREASAGNTSPQIQIRFSEEGQAKFSEVAKKNVGKPIAIYLDQETTPISMAVVDAQLAQGLTGDPVITGNFDVEQAKALSVQIRAGALPISVNVVEQKTIGATLGEESVTKSLFAGLVGLALVLIFLIYSYRRMGILASLSLLIYSTIVLAVFKVVPVVLTLPGIAGLILSIGMASDANILIFERIKEEIAWGKPSNLAIKHGFERAWSSIRDSNVSSLITSYILFQFGTGPVKGFALTLAIGIIISLFTSIFVVRTLIEVFNIGNVSKAK